MTATPCRHCARPIASHVLAKHERACAKHPGDDELLRMSEFETNPQLARRYRVSISLIEDWRKAAGAARRKTTTRETKPPVVAHWELSVLEPCRGGCDDCEWIGVCRARVMRGVPILGEAPLDKEVVAWYLAGWIPGDLRGEALRRENQ